MNDKQIKQYPAMVKKYPVEMSEEDIINFEKELKEFLEDKLGDRAFVFSYGYEAQVAGKYVLRHGLLGLERSMSFWKAMDCLKCIYQQLNGVSQAMSTPLQPITPDNNPLVQPANKK